MISVTIVVLDRAPLDPVRVNAYVPVAVSGVVVILRIDE
jgi:hypothetical protein